MATYSHGMSNESGTPGAGASGAASQSSKEDKTKAAEEAPIKAGDRVNVHVLVGGPMRRTIAGVVKAVLARAPKGKTGGPYLDIAVSVPLEKGGMAESELLAVQPEPPEGASVNGRGDVFPCWARRNLE